MDGEADLDGGSVCPAAALLGLGFFGDAFVFTLNSSAISCLCSAALVAAANAKEKLRTQLFDRRRAIKRLRVEPPVRQPMWLSRDTLARPMYMPRM